MGRWLHLALAVALATAGFVAAGAAARPTGFRLVAVSTRHGIVVRAVGAARVTFAASRGIHLRVLSARSARLDGVWPAAGGTALHLVARPKGSGTTAVLSLTRQRLRRRKQPTTSTATATTTAPAGTAPTTTTTPAPPATATTTAAPQRGAAAVQPPAPYALPTNAVTVSNSAQLQSELAKTTPESIVLADGDYRSSSAFKDANGHHLYAAHLGRAVLHAGIVMGGNYGNPGGSIQGLAFDVSDASLVDDNAVVDVWGPMGTGISVQDTTFDGHAAVGFAIEVVTGEGFTASRIVARNFTSDGVYVDAYPQAPTYAQRPSLSDLDVANVARPVPGSANGTSEACVWLGTPVTLTRAKLRNCAWMGLWTGSNGVGSTYSDVDVDGTPVGVYIEHFTTSSTFQHLHVGSGVRTGIVCEWADPAWGGKPASVDNTIQDSLIESYHVGVYMDEGTTRTRVTSTTFRGQADAAIVDYKGVDNTYSGNDYSGIGASAVPVSTLHL